MKMILCLLTLFLSMKAFSQSEYIFHPEGHFTVTVTEAGPYYFTGFQLKNGKIYSVAENDAILYGTIEKILDAPGTYAFKVSSFPYSSVGTLLSCLENYQIFDERGLWIGQVKGNFSTDSTEPFLFFDGEGRLFARAFLDASHSKITLCSSEDQVLVVCSKTFKYPGFTADPDYYWTIQAAGAALPFDARYLWPFVALVSEVWWRGVDMGGYY